MTEPTDNNQEAIPKAGGPAPVCPVEEPPNTPKESSVSTDAPGSKAAEQTAKRPIGEKLREDAVAQSTELREKAVAQARELAERLMK